MVVGVGFEPTYAMRADLQSAAFNHSATCPHQCCWCGEIPCGNGPDLMASEEAVRPRGGPFGEASLACQWAGWHAQHENYQLFTKR